MFESSYYLVSPPFQWEIIEFSIMHACEMDLDALVWWFWVCNESSCQSLHDRQDLESGVSVYVCVRGSGFSYCQKAQEIIMEDKLLEVVSKAEEATAARVCHTCLSCLSFTCASYMTEVLFPRKAWSFPCCLLVFISPVIYCGNTDWTNTL
jgi:hypothetical protein